MTLSTKDVQLTTDPRKGLLKMVLLGMLPDLLKMDDQEMRQFKEKILDTVDEIMSTRSTRLSSSCPSTSITSFPTDMTLVSTGVFGDYTTVEGTNASLPTLAAYYSTDFQPAT